MAAEDAVGALLPILERIVNGDVPVAAACVWGAIVEVASQSVIVKPLVNADKNERFGYVAATESSTCDLRHTAPPDTL